MATNERHVYFISYNDNKGNYSTGHVIAENDGEAMAKFRESFNVPRDAEVALKAVARGIYTIIA